ncbi:hypothetical protein GQ457_11G022170 [Hibiscus cannabinus]
MIVSCQMFANSTGCSGHFPSALMHLRTASLSSRSMATSCMADTCMFFYSQWFKMRIEKQFPLRLHLFRKRTQNPTSSFLIKYVNIFFRKNRVCLISDRGAGLLSAIEKWCDCGYFQALKSLCQHAIATSINCRRDYKNLVDLVYFLNSVCKFYGMEFPAIGSETEWHGNQTWPTILPNPQVRRNKFGRPNSTRIHNAMDVPQRERTGQPKLCGHCRHVGHTIKNCPSLTQYSDHR